MYYLLVALLLLVAEVAYFWIADRYNIIDKPNERSSHLRVTLRGGGIIFYVGMLVYFLTSGFVCPWFMLGLTGIAAVSFVDDVRMVSQKTRLVVQFAAMLLMFYEWGMTGLPLWWMVVALVFCTGIINAYNFMDGINGITGGYSVVVLGGLAYVNAFVHPFVDGRLIWVMLIAAGVFCLFNFRAKARCFAGDVGSMSMAFVVLFLLGRLIIETQDLSYLTFLAVYGVDSVLTIAHRLMLHENIGEPHRKHLYQIMANELRVPHVAVSGLYMAVQALIIVGYLNCLEFGFWYMLGCLAVLSVVYVVFMEKYFYLHREHDACAKHASVMEVVEGLKPSSVKVLSANETRGRFRYFLSRIRMLL